VWFPLPALRADAVAAGSAGEAATHAAEPSRASALTTAASLSHSASSVHESFLLGDASHSLESPAAPAARHSESTPVKSACEPGLDNLAQIAGHKGNDPDTVGGDHFIQTPGNRATNQSVDAQLCETKCLLYRQVIREKFLRFADSLSGFSFDKVNLLSHIKDRSDSVVPSRKCRLH
jgi:hypothetical protein